MNVTIELQNHSGNRDIPLRRQFKHWALTALQHIAPQQQVNRLSIRIVDEAESATLNSQYRSKPDATNILSFPVPDEMPASPLLGDLAICAQVVNQEAVSQHKTQDAHWAHLTVHGVLHLRGYDHEVPDEAAAMESMEIRILHQLGYRNPYEPQES